LGVRKSTEYLGAKKSADHHPELLVDGLEFLLVNVLGGVSVDTARCTLLGMKVIVKKKGHLRAVKNRQR
jgi:hypothetical protein